MNTPYPTAMPLPRTARRPNGFTLIEVLAVVLIIALLIALTVTLSNTVPDSRQLTSEADNLAGRINYCRLLAVSSGKPVELRLYKQTVIDKNDDQFYRSTQILTTNSNGKFAPDGRMQSFTGKVILSPNSEFSSILADDPNPPDPSATDVGNKLAKDLPYQAIRFYPNGSTDLGRGTEEHWTLTLLTWKQKFEQSTLPPDFITLQVDPFTSKVRRYQPGD